MGVVRMVLERSDMVTFLLLIYFIVLFLGGTIGVVRFSGLTTPSRLLTVLCFVTLLSEAIATYLGYKSNNNSQVYHFYVILSFWIYALVFFYLLPKAKLKVVFYLIAIIYTIACVANSLFYQKLDSFPSINFTLNNFVLVLFSLVYFKSRIDLNPFESAKIDNEYLFNVAVMVYFALQIFIWGIMNYLIKKGLDIMPLVIFGMFVSILYYAVIALSIYLDRGGRVGRYSYSE